jgi:hypothetical protein
MFAWNCLKWVKTFAKTFCMFKQASLLTDEHEATHVIGEVVAVSLFKCWWKLSEKCHNMWWNVGVQVWYQNKIPFIAVGRKIIAVTKKITSDSIKCEGVDYFFFNGKASFIMSSFHMVRHSMDSFTWRSQSVWERQREGRGLRGKTWIQHHDNEPAHTWLLVHEFLAKHETTAIPQPLYSPDLALLFSPLMLKSTLKGRRFHTIEGDRRKVAMAPARVSTKCVPELEKTLQAVYIQWRGVLWRRQSC